MDGIRKYQQLIGTLQWLATTVRMDIQYALASLNRFNATPREGHLKLEIKVLGYLKNTQREDIL